MSTDDGPEAPGTAPDPDEGFPLAVKVMLALALLVIGFVVVLDLLGFAGLV
jgi:hypothetical protein